MNKFIISLPPIYSIFHKNVPGCHVSRDLSLHWQNKQTLNFSPKNKESRRPNKHTFPSITKLIKAPFAFIFRFSEEKSTRCSFFRVARATINIDLHSSVELFVGIANRKHWKQLISTLIGSNQADRVIVIYSSISV